MLKTDEIAAPHSCLNKAAPFEMVFVLRAKDAAAPAAILAWVNERIKLGLNDMQDDKLHEAISCLLTMIKQRTENKYGE